MEAAGRKSNKIRDIVRLHQLLKKWRNQAKVSKTNNNNNNHKGINKFLKKTLSFSENTVSSSALSNQDNNHVPKGYLAVSVGKEGEEEIKRYVIPTKYLGHQAFQILLREAEEEFGFQQQGVLHFPCHVTIFETVVDLVQNNRHFHQHDEQQRQLFFFHLKNNILIHVSPHPQLCR